MKTSFYFFLFCGIGAATAAGPKNGGGKHHSPGHKLTPVVIIPGFHLTTLEVTVRGQTVAPECPTDGTFDEYFFPGRTFSTTFTQQCQDKLLTLRYDNSDPSKPISERFSEQAGVTVAIKNYGKTESCPIFEVLYLFLESHGYVRNNNIVVAGNDSRYAPDQKRFLEKTKKLIEGTYHRNGNTPVHLIGYSNGARYTQYLLTHVTQRWKSKYIHGQTLWAGNYAGEGIFYASLFSGFNTFSFSFPTTMSNALTSAIMYRTHPAIYNSLANPLTYTGANSITVVDTPARSYTAEQFMELFTDAGLSIGLEVVEHFLQLIEFTNPNVDTFVEYGTGNPTLVGAEYPNLVTGQLLGSPIAKNGDGLVTEINSKSIQAWTSMPCYKFEFYENSNVGHFDLIQNSDVLDRLLMHLNGRKSACPHQA